MATETPAAEASNGLRFVLRAFRYRNYRLFFVGQGISFIGTWMHRIAMSWLVYRVTGSKTLLGTVIFASLFPAFLLAPFAGVLSDRLDRRKIIIVANTFAALQALSLALLTFFDVVTVWEIIVLSVLLGVAAGFDIPVRQSFVVEIVEKRGDLANAIALNSSLFNIARVIGPALAGVVVAAAGEATCFLINALSYLAAIGALLAMRTSLRKAKKTAMPVFRGLKEGFSYAFNSKIIRPLLLFLAMLSLFGMPYFALMPVFAKDVLHGGSRTYGFLIGASGIGSLFGAAFLASRRNSLGLVKLISIAGIIFGLGMIAFAFSQFYRLSMLIVPFCGFGLLVAMASSNTVMQSVVDEDKRGRVMSLYTMSFMGMASFGSLFAGIAAERIGAPATVTICGSACVLGSLFFTSRLSLLTRLVRPILEKDGSVPETQTETDRSASSL